MYNKDKNAEIMSMLVCKIERYHLSEKYKKNCKILFIEQKAVPT